MADADRAARGWQAVAAAWLGGHPSFGLFLGGSGLLAGYVRTEAGERWCSGFFDLTPGEWWHLALVHDAERGRLEVHQRRKGEATSAVAARELAAAPVARSDAFMLAAAPPEMPGRPHRAHLNGKLARPVVVGAALDADGSAALGTQPGEGVVAAWDLGALPQSQTAPELSGNAPDGLVVDAPARGVTGPGFAGRAGTLRRDRPEWYDAIYFHDDDLDDAGWPATMSVEVPADAPSGIYAVLVSGEREELPMPFVVRPRAARDRVAFLVPTLTWQAYNSNIAALSYTEDGVLDARPCLYDTHSDGSIVYHTTRRQPTRSTHPRLKPHDWGAHAVAADLDLTAWLDRVGVGWDALGDEQLDALGGAALEGYDCLVLGAHPEYFTRSMQDAVRGFVAGGGRMLYLGGNGMFWVTSIDPERRHLLEVRKVHALNHPLGLEAPGEVQHSFDDEIGGLWEHRISRRAPCSVWTPPRWPSAATTTIPPGSTAPRRRPIPSMPGSSRASTRSRSAPMDPTWGRRRAARWTPSAGGSGRTARGPSTRAREPPRLRPARLPAADRAGGRRRRANAPPRRRRGLLRRVDHLGRQPRPQRLRERRRAPLGERPAALPRHAARRAGDGVSER